jgi:hypothetical protein
MRICFKVVWMLLGGVALSGATSHGFHAEENLALISSLLSGDRLMSAFGPKQTCAGALQMFAFGGKADIPIALPNVRL